MRLLGLPCNSVRQNSVGSKSRSYEENCRFKAKPIFCLKPLQFVHISILSVKGRGLGCGGKIGVCFRTSCENSGSFWFVCILHTDYILVSEMDGLMAPKPSITDSWHGNLNFRSRSRFCFWTEYYFRNNAYSSAFPCALANDHSRGRFCVIARTCHYRHWIGFPGR